MTKKIQINKTNQPRKEGQLQTWRFLARKFTSIEWCRKKLQVNKTNREMEDNFQLGVSVFGEMMLRSFQTRIKQEIPSKRKTSLIRGRIHSNIARRLLASRSFRDKNAAKFHFV
ncbi:uncharacterized protein LOC144637849 isoform X1 [Oculina patagonica]